MGWQPHEEDTSTYDLESFPHPFVDEVDNLQAAFIYGRSDEHGPSHGAWTIDVAGGTLVASTIGRESEYGLPDVLMDLEASTFDETDVVEVTASGNLVTIGGGDVNLVSRYYEFLEVDGGYAMPVVDVLNEAGWAVGIHSRRSGTGYYREGSYGEGAPVTDYALAAIYGDGDRYVLWVAGVTGHTTKAMCMILADYVNYDLSGRAVIVQFIDEDGDASFESIHVVERIAATCMIYGLNFGPYTREGQDPNRGTVVSEEQIRELMTTIAPYTEWVRTFGCNGGLEDAGRIAHDLGLKIAVGAWIDDNLISNEEQISCLIGVAKAGEADMAIVGSEVLLRHDLTENQLIEYINRVKEEVPGIPVATADVYGELLEHPAVMAAGDVVLPNYYPYWEGVSIDYAVYHIHLRHQEVVAAAAGKPVIVAETGWPSGGQQIGSAVPSPMNAALFFLNFVSWAKAEDVSYFHFEAFDEPWKAGYEGPCGAHWGVWDRDGNLKPGMERVFNCETIPNNWGTEIIDGPGDPAIEFTHVPPYGGFDDLEGRVSHVKPADCRVAVYIKVGGGWWTKPYWNNPSMIIWPDGNWRCDITTGGIDEQATKITAFLLPTGYNPPLMSGGPTLPPQLYDNALAEVETTRSP